MLRHEHQQHFEGMGQTTETGRTDALVAGKHPKTPWHAKALGMLVVAYALSPIDLVPDFIPVLGYLDDVLLLPGLIWLTIKLLPPDVLVDCRAQVDDWIETRGSKPRSRFGAVLIVTVWLLTAAAIWFWVSH